MTTMRDIAADIVRHRLEGEPRDEFIAREWAVRCETWLPEYHPSKPGAFDRFKGRILGMLEDFR